MVLQEGHFNGLLPLLPCQANGHHKMAKNCYDKWEMSTIAGGSGLVYSVDKGSNIITEAGQLVMDKLVEVPMPTSANLATSFTQPTFSPHLAATQPGVQFHPAVTQLQPGMQFHPAVAHQAMQFHPVQYQLPPVQPDGQSSTGLTFVQCQPGPPTDATAGLDTASTVTSSALVSGGTGSSWKQCAQVPVLQNTVQTLVANMNDNANKMLTTIGTDKVEQLDEVLSLVYDLEKNLSEKNLVHLQMLLEEKPSFVVGYKNAAAKSTMYRMWWVKMRLEAVGYSVLEYACLQDDQQE
ncbi:hypothetical protein F5141DRAFT_1063656 [Pisolithus sp. B1]|nr:hypothetical protein F5141DRAFT_1063656 [Pisolithus sp. B1]